MIRNSKNIVAQKVCLNPKVILRSDLGVIKIDDFSFIGESALIKPTIQQTNTQNLLSIGKYTYIGAGSIVKSLRIGNCV
jgi:carbonic anhydrase/acetyltransferase-like protein (isoleucine patch superfamily)